MIQTEIDVYKQDISQLGYKSQWGHAGVFASLCRLDILSRFVNNKKVDDPFRVVHQKV